MKDEIKEGYVRVTDILRHFSGINHVPQEVLMKAADRGRRTHNALDGILNGLEPMTPDEDILGYLDSFKVWTLQNDFKPISLEERLYDDELKITGKYDGLIEFKGERYLIDFKTPVKESKTWPIQLSAYAHMLRQDVKIAVIQLKKNGKEAAFIEYEKDFSKFKACYDVYHLFYK